jgi:hypothetical protein
VPSLEVTVGVTVEVGVGVGDTGKQQSVSYTTLTGVEPERTDNPSFIKQKSTGPIVTVSGYVDAVKV